MKIAELQLRKEFVTPDQSICDFLNLNLLGVPVVEKNKPVAYITLKRILGELLTKEVFLHAAGIGKDAGNLEFTEEAFLTRFTEKSIARHAIPLLATVEHDDPLVKAASLMILNNIPLIAVTQNEAYIGYVTYELLCQYIFSFCPIN